MRAWLLCLLFPAVAQAAPSITWAGVDYGLVHLVGTQDFQDTEAIFPGFFDTWNVMVLDEQADDLRKRLGREVIMDVHHLPALHAQANPDQQIVRNDLITTDQYYLTEEIIQARLRSYPHEGAGLGLVFIADQLNKPAAQGCFWVTVFDKEDKELRSARRVCAEAHGFGFRNYWFGSVKGVIKELRNLDVPKR